MLKIYLMGEGGVGKSAVTLRYITRNFIEYYDPTIEDSYTTKILVDDRLSNITIVDTAGQEEYISIRNNWIEHGDGFILIYSIDSRNSFDEIKILMDEITTLKEKIPPVVLIGNKSDLKNEREVSKNEGKELANLWNCIFYETSAKDDININQTFFDIVREIRKYKINNKPVIKKKKKRCIIS